MSQVLMLGYVGVLLGSIGMILFSRFGLASSLDEHRLSGVRALGMNGAQVWIGAWALIIGGTLLQLVGSRQPATPAPENAGLQPALAQTRAPVEISSSTSWDRMRQCSEQVDHVASREGWLQGRAPGGRVSEWSNHYSQRFQRCYVQLEYVNDAAKTDKDLPPLTYSLFDPFENRNVAICTDILTKSQAANFCAITEGAEGREIGNCSACRDFVRERMFN